MIISIRQFCARYLSLLILFFRRTTEAARQSNTDAKRDDWGCDGPHYRRGHSHGRLTDPAYARGGAEQVANGGSREADESRSHTKGATIPRGVQFARGRKAPQQSVPKAGHQRRSQRERREES